LPSVLYVLLHKSSTKSFVSIESFVESLGLNITLAQHVQLSKNNQFIRGSYDILYDEIILKYYYCKSDCEAKKNIHSCCQILLKADTLISPLQAPAAYD
jgi:hypothetical protein